LFSLPFEQDSGNSWLFKNALIVTSKQRSLIRRKSSFKWTKEILAIVGLDEDEKETMIRRGCKQKKRDYSADLEFAKRRGEVRHIKLDKGRERGRKREKDKRNTKERHTEREKTGGRGKVAIR